MAVKDSEFYVLNKKYFKEAFFVEYREIGLELLKHAYERKNRMKKVFKSAVEFSQKMRDQAIVTLYGTFSYNN